jgi:hypothetical protein
MKEATSRIKINKLLESAGWRFFAEGRAPANSSVCLRIFSVRKYVNGCVTASNA